MKKSERDKTLLTMRFWTILIPSLFFSYATDTFHLTVLCLSAFLYNFMGNGPVKVSLRSAIYSITLALTVIVLTNTIFEVEGRFYLTPSEMGIPTALIFSMALLFFDDRPSFSASILIMSVFSMMMCGDITNSHVFKNLPLPSVLGKMEYIHLIYVLSLVLSIIPFYYLMNRSQNKLAFTSNTSFKMNAIKFSIIISCLVAVFILYRPTQRVVVPFTKDLESKMVRAISQWRFSKKKTAFQKNVDLRDSYFNFDHESENVILIRVESPRTPGYIRSRVYEQYKDGIWGSTDDSSVMNLLSEEHEYSFNTFSFNGEEQVSRDELEKIQIYYSGNFKVENILHQGKSRYLEMTCEVLNQTDSGTVSGTELDFASGVTLFNEKGWSSEDSFKGPELNENNRGQYLLHDLDYKVRLNNLINSIDILKGDTDDPNVFAAKIAYFFNKKYTYQLGVKLQRDKDPVMAFLTPPTDEDRKGHCEYFATSAVMMLRAKNIPARYVTGFYCQEQHPNGEYYLGRSMDLHAWVEYYDEKAKVWRLLEPTPASGMPNGKKNFNFFSAAWDSFVKRWQDLMANIVKGYFAESVILFLKGILDIAIWCFNSIPKAIISLTLIFLWYRRRWKKRKKIVVAQDLKYIHKDLKKLLKKLAGIKGFSINEAMTIREIIREIDQQNNPMLQAYSACLREYESIRYNPSMRNSNNIIAMKKKINLTLKSRVR